MSQRSPFNQRNMPKGGGDEESSTPSGMTKKSASKAKPVRAAAQSVRVAPAKSKGKASGAAAKPLSKEERKEQRRREREEEDQVASLTERVMKKDPLYIKRRRVWWGLLIVGVICIVITFAVSSMLGGNASSYDVSTPTGLVSIVTLVLSYAIILGSIIWEFVKIRPLRNEAMAKVRSMSPKRRRTLIEESFAEDEQRRAEKAARKAAKKK